MKGFFSYDSWYGRLMVGITNCCYLFVLWVLFSLPVVTIGASTCAFYYTFSKVIIKERDYIGRSFIKSFKENFIQATGVFLLQIAIFFILGLSSYYLILFKGNFKDFFSWVFIGCVTIVYIWTRYWFPYISCFADKTRTVLKNCLMIMVGNIPWTFLILVLFAIWLLVIYKYTGWFLISWVAYMALNGLIFNHILKKYMPPEIEDNDSNEEIE
ncbi:MAG: YesL family protein [Lachnospiraceae bacterium]|nr:YesL family protein [Lachnospiraceae bacterium]